MLKQVEEEIEYHIYDVADTDRTNRIVTFSRKEAQKRFKEGKIVYEIRRTATQAEWLAFVQELRYEWHQE